MTDREKSDRPPFWTPGMIVACSALALVVLLFLLWFALNAAAQGAVDREIAKIRARGEPVTMKEVAPPPVPDEENAAVVFELAFAELDICQKRMTKKDRRLRTWYHGSLDPFEPARQRAETVLEFCAEPMRLAREALERPRCRFNLDYSQGFLMRLGHVGKLTRLMGLFEREALVHAHSGRPEEAADSVVQMLRLARRPEEPFLHPNIMCSMLAVRALATLNRVDAMAELSAETRARLMQQIPKGQWRRACMGACKAERVTACDYFARLTGEDARNRSSHLRPQNLFVRLLRFRVLKNQARLLGFFAEALDAMRLPAWEAIPALEAFENRTEAVPDRKAMLPCLLLPSPKTGFASFVDADALASAALMGQAAELFREQHGRYPDSLDEFVPGFLAELPSDPFSGKPFVYRKRVDGKGFVVYSVGPNLKDDGGSLATRLFDGDTGWERAPAGKAGEEPGKTRSGGAGMRSGAPPE